MDGEKPEPDGKPEAPQWSCKACGAVYPEGRVPPPRCPCCGALRHPEESKP